MAQFNFNNVPSEGFIAFADELATDKWATIDITPYVGPKQTTTQPIFGIPSLITCKILLIWVLDTLMGVHGVTDNAKKADKLWDNAQRRLRSLIEMWAAHHDALKCEAAARLRKALLLGAGTAQTMLGYHQEVDFARQQLKTVSTTQTAADIALLGLGVAIDDIREATDALADAISYGQTSSRPFEQRQMAMTNCIATFESVTQTLTQIADNKGLEAQSILAAKLRVPFEALIKRYPATSTTTTNGAADDEKPSPPDDNTPSI
jgi:hypothetical protein